jgi:hypothetical protein
MLVFCSQIFAQAGINKGNVTGTVKDPSGGTITSFSGARVLEVSLKITF